jgi:hypothetical protein
VTARVCQFGMEAHSAKGKALVMKPMRFPSSSEDVRKYLARRCPRYKEHHRLSGGRASAAAIYPPEPSTAMVRGIDAQMRREGKMLNHSLQEIIARGCSESVSRKCVCVCDEGDELAKHVPQRY